MHRQYTCASDSVSDRDEDLYEKRGKVARTASRAFHRVIQIQRGKLTAAEQLARRYNLWTVPQDPAEPGPLRPMPRLKPKLLQKQSLKTKEILKWRNEVMDANVHDHSNCLQHDLRNYTIANQVSTVGNNGSATDLAMVRQSPTSLPRAAKNQAGVRAKFVSARTDVRQKIRELSPGSERDAEHETLDGEGGDDAAFRRPVNSASEAARVLAEGRQA